MVRAHPPARPAGTLESPVMPRILVRAHKHPLTVVAAQPVPRIDAMRVLLTNDDGIGAEGMHSVRRALLEIEGIEVHHIRPLRAGGSYDPRERAGSLSAAPPDRGKPPLDSVSDG